MLNIFGAFFSTTMNVLPGLDWRNAPSAAPPMIRTSKGWMMAPILPPESRKPPRTLAKTTMMPMIFDMRTGRAK